MEGVEPGTYISLVLVKALLEYN